MRTRTLIIAVAAAAMLVPGAASEHATAAARTASEPGACQPAWRLTSTPAAPDVTAPSAQFASDDLNSVSPLSGHEAMFGGYEGGKPWTLRWHGGSFTEPAQVSQSPFMTNLGAAQSSFDSASDGWQLMSQQDAVTEENPDVALVDHLHDGHWSMTAMADSPDPATRATRPFAISAVSPSDAWAVGGLYHVGPDDSFGVSPAGTLIERWDGTQWKIVPNPAQAQDGAELWGLTVRSPDDIWAVGSQGTDTAPFTEHWDGTAWHVVAVPSPGAPQNALLKVSADGPDDAWAYGLETAPAGADFLVPFVEHWDGTGWKIVTLPDTGSTEEPGAGGVYAASSSDVWVTTPAFFGNGPVFLHWDGNAWSIVRAQGPQLRGAYYEFRTMAGSGPDDVWAVGLIYENNQTLYLPLVAHLSCG